MKAIEKIKKFAMHKFLRFSTVFVLFEYYAFLLRYLAGIEK